MPVAVMLLGAIFAAPLQAETRGPSTPEERARVIKLNDHLEAEPLAPDARDARRWLIGLASSAPDLKVVVCPDLLAPLFESKHPYAAELGTQMMFSTLAFTLAHPDKADDAQAIYLAAVLGSLRAYQSIVKAKPGSKLPFLDDLVARRDKGSLAEYVRRLALEKCN
jgi:hypothetical protein